eukprot:354060-Chlamydomonas_euryale.AAC.16
MGHAWGSPGARGTCKRAAACHTIPDPALISVPYDTCWCLHTYCWYYPSIASALLLHGGGNAYHGFGNALAKLCKGLQYQKNGRWLRPAWDERGPWRDHSSLGRHWTKGGPGAITHHSVGMGQKGGLAQSLVSRSAWDKRGAWRNHSSLGRHGTKRGPGAITHHSAGMCCGNGVRLYYRLAARPHIRLGR